MNRYTLIYIDTTQIDWNKKRRKTIRAANLSAAESIAREFCARNQYALHDLIFTRKGVSNE